MIQAHENLGSTGLCVCNVVRGGETISLKVTLICSEEGDAIGGDRS